jgi:hypothetical protein
MKRETELRQGILAHFLHVIEFEIKKKVTDHFQHIINMNGTRICTDDEKQHEILAKILCARSKKKKLVGFVHFFYATFQ